MKSILFSLVSLVSVVSFAGVPLIQAPFTCATFEEANAKGLAIYQQDYDCAAEDVACKDLERKQLTYAMTGYFTDVATSEVSQEKFDELDSLSDGAYRVKATIGDIVLEGANLGPGGGDTTVITYFYAGTLTLAPISEYSGEISVGSEYCDGYWPEEAE